MPKTPTPPSSASRRASARISPSAIPADASAFPDRQGGGGAEQGRRQGHQRAAGQAVRGGQAGAAGDPAGHRHGRQGRHHPPRVQRDRAARRHRHGLPPAERGGAGARFPVARASGLPAPRHPSASSTARTTRTCWSCACASWRRPRRSSARYEQINDFERMLTENGTTILKFMLHISKEEQGERLQDRLDEPDEPLEVQSRRPGGPQAVGRVPGRLRDHARPLLDRAWAPWHVIPADRKWARNAAIAAHRARDAGGDGPAVSQAGLEPEGFQGGVNG